MTAVRTATLAMIIDGFPWRTVFLSTDWEPSASESPRDGVAHWDTKEKKTDLAGGAIMNSGMEKARAKYHPGPHTHQ